jgi:hypothetical protein
MGREHYEIVRALRELEGDEFNSVIYKTLGGFASRWISATRGMALVAADQK